MLLLLTRRGGVGGEAQEEVQEGRHRRGRGCAAGV